MLLGRVNEPTMELDLGEEALRVTKEKFEATKRKIASITTQEAKDKVAAMTEAKP